jgi:hypothetical protein
MVPFWVWFLFFWHCKTRIEDEKYFLTISFNEFPQKNKNQTQNGTIVIEW